MIIINKGRIWKKQRKTVNKNGIAQNTEEELTKTYIKYLKMMIVNGRRY